MRVMSRQGTSEQVQASLYRWSPGLIAMSFHKFVREEIYICSRQSKKRKKEKGQGKKPGTVPQVFTWVLRLCRVVMAPRLGTLCEKRT